MQTRSDQKDIRDSIIKSLANVNKNGQKEITDIAFSYERHTKKLKYRQAIPEETNRVDQLTELCNSNLLIFSLSEISEQFLTSLTDLLIYLFTYSCLSLSFLRTCFPTTYEVI